MGLFSKKNQITLKKGDVAFVLTKGGFELYMDNIDAPTSANYYASVISWLLTSPDSDARLLWSAAMRKVNERFDKFEAMDRAKIEREAKVNGTAGSDNQ